MNGGFEAVTDKTIQLQKRAVFHEKGRMTQAGAEGQEDGALHHRWLSPGFDT